MSSSVGSPFLQDVTNAERFFQLLWRSDTQEMSTCILSEIQESIKLEVKQQVRQMTERIEPQIRHDVEKNLREQFQLFWQQQLLNARERSADMANASRHLSQCHEASPPSVEHNPQSIEGRIKTEIQQSLERNAQQMKCSMDDLATSIFQQAVQQLEAKLADQLVRNTESLKASFQQQFNVRQQHVHGTLDALRKQMEAELKTALEFMRCCFCEEAAVFKQELQSGFASLRAQVGEVIKQEILNLKKVIHEEFAALRRENKREFSAIKQEFVTLRWEHRRDLSAFKEELTALRREHEKHRVEIQDEFSAFRRELRTMSELHHREAVANHAKFDQLITLISKIRDD